MKAIRESMVADSQRFISGVVEKREEGDSKVERRRLLFWLDV